MRSFITINFFIFFSFTTIAATYIEILKLEFPGAAPQIIGRKEIFATPFDLDTPASNYVLGTGKADIKLPDSQPKIGIITGTQLGSHEKWQLRNTGPRAISIFDGSTFLQNLETGKAIFMKAGLLYKVAPSTFIRLK